MDHRARLETEGQPDVTNDLASIAFRAGMGHQIMREQEARSSDAVGDRIVAAAQKISGADLWGSDADSWIEDETGLRP